MPRAGRASAPRYVTRRSWLQERASAPRTTSPWSPSGSPHRLSPGSALGGGEAGAQAVVLGAPLPGQRRLVLGRLDEQVGVLVGRGVDVALQGLQQALLVGPEVGGAEVLARLARVGAGGHRGVGKVVAVHRRSPQRGKFGSRRGTICISGT